MIREKNKKNDTRKKIRKRYDTRKIGKKNIRGVKGKKYDTRKKQKRN